MLSDAERTACKLKKWGYRSARSVDEDVLQMPSAIETNSSWEIVKRNLYSEVEPTINETNTYDERSFPVMNAKFKRARLEDESPAQRECRLNIEAMKKLLPCKEEQSQSEAEQVVGHFVDYSLLENAYLRTRYHEIKKKRALEEEDETDSSENADQGEAESNEIANEEEEEEEANNDSYNHSDQEEEGSEEDSYADEDAVSEIHCEDIDDDEEEEEEAEDTTIANAVEEDDLANECENTPFEMVSGILSSILDIVTNEKHNESEAEVVVGRGKLFCAMYFIHKKCLIYEFTYFKVQMN